MTNLKIIKTLQSKGMYLPEEEYGKALGQFRLALNGVFLPFNCYGLQDLVPGAITQTINLTEDFSLRVRGIDKPISYDYVRRKI